MKRIIELSDKDFKTSAIAILLEFNKQRTHDHDKKYKNINKPYITSTKMKYMIS